MTESLLALLDALPPDPVHLGAEVTTRDELLALVDAHATALADAGVAAHEPVAVQLPNGPSLVAALFAVWRLDAVYTPLNPRAGAEDVARHLTGTRPAALLSADGVVALDGGEARPGDVALVQFTSGTTGQPKAVPLTHDTVLDMLDRVVRTIRTRPDASPKPPMPNVVPLSLSLWAGIYQVLFAFRVGAPVVLMERFETREFARLVHRYGIRSTVLPPAALVMLVDDDAVTDLGPLRIVRSITAPLAPLHARRFHERFRAVVLNSYGQTEVGGEVAGWSVEDVRTFGESKLGSVGRGHPGIGIRTDEDTGELLVRTPSTAAGNVAPDLRDRLLDDGWFRTGDVGRIDGDGFVWIDGRTSDMINRGGNKVFPAHVEDAILASPAVRDVAVVGVPDDRLGEVPWAFLVPDREPIPVDEVAAWCRQRLTPYKVPVGFTWLDELPRNETGKVLRAALASSVAP